MSKERKKIICIDGAFGQDGQIISQEILCNKGGDYDFHVITHRELVNPNFVKNGASFQTWFWGGEDYSEIRHLIEHISPDFYINLAACHKSTVEMSIEKDSYDLYDKNYRRSALLISALNEVKSECHFNYASSSLIYQSSLGERRIFPSTFQQPDGAYALSKSKVMRLIDYYRSAFGLKAAVSILFNHDSELRKGNYLLSRISDYLRGLRVNKYQPDKKLFIKNIGVMYDLSSAHTIALKVLDTSLNKLEGNYILSSGSAIAVKDVLAWSFDVLSLKWQDYVQYEMDREFPYLSGASSFPDIKLERNKSQQKKIVQELIATRVYS